MPKVILGMSGGVDSSVSALLLKNQGYVVTGVYMKNWSEDLPGMRCPWAEDLADAKRIAVRLGLDFEIWDFETEYREKVVATMLKDFERGETPNPDIVCNEEIKFKLFFEKALEKNADFIATGHYAKNLNGRLARAVDENKDQTYFLYRIENAALEKTLFPLGDLKKPEVKKIADSAGFPNAYKRESMGVCFVGEVGMVDFLRRFLKPVPGEIREAETDRLLGSHEGALLYTLGQRHGLYLSGLPEEKNPGLPFYVVGKDLAKNIVYVSRNLEYPSLWTDRLPLRDILWRDASPDHSQTSNRDASDRDASLNSPAKLLVRLRHRGELIPATFKNNTILFEQKIRRPAPGQSAVFYDDTFCLGGGIIAQN